MGDATEEVAAAFAAYEQALVANDVDVLNDFFWHDERALRFGLEGTQRGYDTIAAWRVSAPAIPPGRTLHNTVVTQLAPDVVVVDTEFTYTDHTFAGRQSQVWIRVDAGWRIARAHVSELSESEHALAVESQ